jgi:hypothetical protein
VLTEEFQIVWILSEKASPIIDLSEDWSFLGKRILRGSSDQPFGA